MEIEEREMKEKYKKLDEDFSHNLEVIESRDADIVELSQKLVQLRDICEEKNAALAKIEREGNAELESFKLRSNEKQRGLFEKIEELK